jgi:uncharacterized SAM-dependent methyltransferase
MAYQEQRSERLTFYLMNTAQQHETFVQDVAAGLATSPKTLPAKYFYDTRGSQLYEQICTLPEYYPYRAERDILATSAPEIYAAIGHVPLVEFGSGNAAKTRYLLTAYERAGRPFLYCPVDIARTALEASAQKLLAEYAHLSICAIHADLLPILASFMPCTWRKKPWRFSAPILATLPAPKALTSCKALLR